MALLFLKSFDALSHLLDQSVSTQIASVAFRMSEALCFFYQGFSAKFCQRFLNPYYTALILHSVETRLARIYEKDVLRVQVLDFEWMPDMIRDDLDELIRMDHTKGDDGKFVFICRAWRRLFGITGLIEMQELRFPTYWTKSLRATTSKAPEKLYIVDLSYLRSMDKGTMNVPYMLASILAAGASRRKHGAMMAGGHFIGHLAEHFVLVSDAGLAGLTVIS
ncbi:hypothetical protein Tco_0637225 [Tanacetum coccineum]